MQTPTPTPTPTLGTHVDFSLRYHHILAQGKVLGANGATFTKSEIVAAMTAAHPELYSDPAIQKTLRGMKYSRGAILKVFEQVSGTDGCSKGYKLR